MSTERRYVFDANALISALLIPDSVPRKAFDKALTRGEFLLSGAVLAEIESVLTRPKFQKYLHDDDRIQFLVALVRESSMVSIKESVTDCRDAKDNKYLELAYSGRATCLISGDEDLISLSPFRGIPILTPRQFLDAGE